jgi:trk system potassium uptake protein TrkA
MATTKRNMLGDFWQKVRSQGNAPASDTSVVSPQATLKAQPVRRSGNRVNEFVVIGLGRFGASVARTLVSHGYNVLAIDRNGDRVQELSTMLPNVMQIDTTSQEALRQAGVDSFDTGLVCIGEDFESSILTTVQLRLLGVKRIIAKARSNTQRQILLQVGADEVILPEHEAGVRLAKRLVSSHFIDFLEVVEDVGVVELSAPPSTWGRSLAEADVRNQFGLTVVAVRRADELVVSPASGFMIEEDDILVVMGRIADAEKFNQ